MWVVMRIWHENGRILYTIYGPFDSAVKAEFYSKEKGKILEGTYSTMLLVEPYEQVPVLCCIHPPGDGSTCAGGSCCCTENYKCDLCKTRSGEE